MTIKFQAKTKTGFTVDSPLQAFTFPAGEAHIKGAEHPTGYEYQIADLRGMNHSDLFTLAMWEDAVHERGEKSVILLPYLPGARADRGVPAGADIYGEFIANLDVDLIITIDPHSPEWVDNWTNCMEAHEASAPGVFKSTELVVFPFERIIKREIQDGSSDNKPQTYVGVIAPDKGAVDRATRAAKVMGVPVYRAEKTRDFATGKLSGFEMLDELPEEGKLLIVDDICDGGGTFVGLAKATGLPKDRLDLWVTHGIFSKGFDQLDDMFGTIHTTDSFYGTVDMTVTLGTWWSDCEIEVHSITPYLYSSIDL